MTDLSPRPHALCIESLRRHLQARTGRAVQCIETHISWVLLDGDHAWKIKKPVRLGFVDFTDLATRRAACEDEVRLNRRLAPALYLGVRPIHAGEDGPSFDGDGPTIDYAVWMYQFAVDARLSVRARTGTLDGTTVDRLAVRLATFHMQAARAGADTPYGDPAGVLAETERVLVTLGERGMDAPRGALATRQDPNEEAPTHRGPGPSPAARLDAIARWCRAEGMRLLPRFAARKVRGWIRDGHGDLHLDNLVALGDDVTAFDCIEFDPNLRWVDVQADIAFLTMDLQAHGRPDLAWRFLDRWLEDTGDFDGLAVHRYYAVYRALVRSMVALIRRDEGLGGEAAEGADGGSDPGESRRTSRLSSTRPQDADLAYLDTADALAGPGRARLLITHGLSGSGKSFVTKRLLEAAGAVRLRSDVERKRLLGLRALDTTAALGQQIAYAPRTTQRTYARLGEAAAAALDGGLPVIVDAAFLRRGERLAFQDLARAMRVPFTILALDADPETLRGRVAARHTRGDDPSEADVAILKRQYAYREPLGADERTSCIDVDTTKPADIDTIAARWCAMR